MKMLVPVIMVVVGLVGGLGAGHFLKPAPEETAKTPAEAGAQCDPAKDAKCAETAEDYAKAAPKPAKAAVEYDYVKLNKQFVVPVVTDEAVSALIVLSLTLEVDLGFADAVFKQEPKLRDLLLQVLFEHAHSGGFDGIFTANYVMADLRGRLRETAQRQLGPAVHDVLITDIVRRDL